MFYLKLFGIPAGSLLICVVLILLALWLYPQARLFVGDMSRVIGRFSKWVRRKSLEAEIEGSINSFAKNFNSEFSDQIFPDCTVKWVNSDTAVSCLEPGKAIVRLSFGEDHDLNLFNAGRIFIEVSLLSKTKPFLKDFAGKALDHFMLKSLLHGAHRRALNIFNARFRELEEPVKDRFLQYEETDQRGLFKRILLQEYQLAGDILIAETPSLSHQEELEKFWEWFYDLATRESEEISDLSFQSKHLNIGVILVAHPDTY